MSLKKVSVFFFLVILSFSNVYAKRGKIIGKFTRTQGGVLINTKHYSKNPRKGTKVYEGDTVITGQLARAEVKLKDGTVITLGENTEFKFDEYDFQPKKKEGSTLLSMIKGAFAAVTGQITKMTKKEFRVRTPVATIGIKGTTFWGGFWKSGNFDVALLDGSPITIENEKGKQTIAKVGDGVTIPNGGGAPTAPKTWKTEKVLKAKNTVKFGKI